MVGVIACETGCSHLLHVFVLYSKHVAFMIFCRSINRSSHHAERIIQAWRMIWSSWETILLVYNFEYDAQ